MSMTWKDLALQIEHMTEEQKNTDVTFFDSNDDEFYSVGLLSFTNKDDENGDVLDNNHPYLAVFENPRNYEEDEDSSFKKLI